MVKKIIVIAILLITIASVVLGVKVFQGKEDYHVTSYEARIEKV